MNQDDLIRDHECRIQKLETNDAVMGVKIENLISTMTNLLAWIKALFFALLPGVGFLFYLVFKK